MSKSEIEEGVSAGSMIYEKDKKTVYKFPSILMLPIPDLKFATCKFFCMSIAF
jgi:hypothetical protein